MEFEKIRSLIVEQFSVDEADVTMQSKFSDLDADSLELIDLIMSIEEEFEIEVADEDVESITTVAEMVEYVREKTV